MSSYLLDTHSFLWYLNDDVRISLRAKQTINDPDNLIHISIASLWEISIKVSLGKLSIPEPFTTFVSHQLVENQFDILPISVEHLSQVVELPFIHRDPFDRLVIAQSIVEDIPIIGQDQLMKQYGSSMIW